jgi:hypothetical protein
MPAGISLEVRNYGEAMRAGNELPLVSIIGCNSQNPLSMQEVESQMQRNPSDITHIVDVGYRSELRERVLRLGGQYLSDVGSLDPDLLLSAMEPLPELVQEQSVMRSFGLLHMEDELLEARNFGVTTLQEIREKLSAQQVAAQDEVGQPRGQVSHG